MNFLVLALESLANHSRFFFATSKFFAPELSQLMGFPILPWHNFIFLRNAF